MDSKDGTQSESAICFSDVVRRRRIEHNKSVLEKCVTIMREHDKRAEMANFARCGCEFCKVVRHYEPPDAELMHDGGKL